jgi:hypothetical protein
MKNPLCSTCGQECAIDPETSLFFCADCEEKYGLDGQNGWFDDDDYEYPFDSYLEEDIQNFKDSQ